MFSVFTLKKKKAGTEQNGQKDWGLPNNLKARQLNMWNGELNSLCCLLGSKQNSLSWAAQTRSLSEARHSRDSFQKLHLPYILFLCRLIYFQERLQLPASLEALKFLFSKPQAITDKISINLPRWLQLIALFTNNRFQRDGAAQGYAPGWHSI